VPCCRRLCSDPFNGQLPRRRIRYLDVSGFSWNNRFLTIVPNKWSKIITKTFPEFERHQRQHIISKLRACNIWNDAFTGNRNYYYFILTNLQFLNLFWWTGNRYAFTHKHHSWGSKNWKESIVVFCGHYRLDIDSTTQFQRRSLHSCE
jgi:hypothetical protein